MPFADGDTTRTQIHETLKLLHKTIQKQTKATNWQSITMIVLTVAIFILTAALLYVAIMPVNLNQQISTKKQANDNQTEQRINKNNIGLSPNIKVTPIVVKAGDHAKHK